ncbi:radical SAM family heme chaperone HemW [Pseudogemmatithrix spongiicola]|uniref:Heme chaperone HemW n=1 Tax=Pseudogemmatithrix spongiicola TaxID=3062599 RepID=A0AA49Q755_9BACT|nr:radical SAM family heme chaperone HemW [Gemmatimonadaceae bacterium 'strain 138']WKW15343.1 radical SAM family heme chaperone HemW [Gemmatimonadaceae bacterium 'strain 318']
MTDYQHIYLHVPFCGRRCSYCDFSIAVRREVPVSEYVDAIMAELVTRQIRNPDGPLKSLYFGGGTPSKLGGPGVEQVIHRLARWANHVDLSTFLSDAEVTLEANPEDVTAEAAERWVAAGVNRVSLGVQSFDPSVLDWMHRGHGPEGARAAVATLKAVGIRELSVDLIFAVPEHLNRSWTGDLEAAVSLDVDHVSVYGLTVESHTPLGRWTARGEVAEAPEERYEREFLEAHERLTAAGFEHYEVSNYAKPGRRARHNSAYWTGVPYLGLGPSAHGFDGRERRWNTTAYAAWQRQAMAGEDPVEGREVVAEQSSAAERWYLGLRTRDGLELRPDEVAKVAPWVAAGWATLVGSRVRLTPTGWLRLDALVAQAI